MEGELLISFGARVMLTSNLWTNARLVNRALGIVEKFVYNPRCSPLWPCTYVLVRSDNYLEIHYYYL